MRMLQMKIQTKIGTMMAGTILVGTITAGITEKETKHTMEMKDGMKKTTTTKKKKNTHSRMMILLHAWTVMATSMLPKK